MSEGRGDFKGGGGLGYGYRSGALALAVLATLRSEATATEC